MKMAESSPKGEKTLWEKAKLLVTSNFSFSHRIFKRLALQTLTNQDLFGKGLNSVVLKFCIEKHSLVNPLPNNLGFTLNVQEGKNNLKTLWEKESQHFLLFIQCFLPFSNQILIFNSFILLFANAFNLNKSKILE